MTHELIAAEAGPDGQDGPRDGRGRRTRRSTRPGRRGWVQHVEVNVQLLEARLAALRGARDVVREREARRRRAGQTRRRDLHRRLAAEDAVDRRVQELLARARAAARREHPEPWRIVNWWGGRHIEAAYQNLHGAEALIARLYDWNEIRAEVPEAVARIESGLLRDDPRRDAALQLADADPEKSSLEGARAALTKVIEIGHSVADRDHTQLRSFRNVIIVSSLVITVLLVVTAAYVWVNPSTIPLCFTPPNAEGKPATWVCPTGEYPWNAQTPTVEGPMNKHDIVVVLLLGVLGGAFSAAISIRGLSGTSTPYDVPLSLAILKLPLGALTALGGLIALQGDFVPGLSELDSQGQILAYALIFGYAQQLLSGLLDRRAQTLLESAPGKEKDLGYGARASTSSTTHRRRSLRRRDNGE
ncbi:hypothetical protein [Nocardioides taihuensis]|uniref:Uncharacterized protein n=1 Tax=Nocardioides taihuensis TaxID=1835606 RepID=A0ABW0BH21_9ACTN